MKHIFILNPAAGNGKIVKNLHPKIITACKKNDIDYEIHRTVSMGDARNFTKKKCEQSGGKPIRFYSCGGDGTSNEVLNGLIEFDNAELAVIPSGTGNDFVRNFENNKLFLDIDSQINGISSKIDAIKYEFADLTQSELEIFKKKQMLTEGFVLNLANMGFDAQAVEKAAQYKRKPLMGGKLSYIAGVVNALIELSSVKIKIELEDRSLSGDYLLVGIANGKFSGGGFEGTPQAIVNDGYLDINLVKKVNRRFFISLVKSYHNGTHINEPKLKDVYSHEYGKNVVIEPLNEVIVAIDGETIKARSVRFVIKKGIVSFVIPKGAEVSN